MTEDISFYSTSPGTPLLWPSLSTTHSTSLGLLQNHGGFAQVPALGGRCWLLILKACVHEL